MNKIKQTVAINHAMVLFEMREPRLESEYVESISVSISEYPFEPARNSRGNQTSRIFFKFKVRRRKLGYKGS